MREIRSSLLIPVAEYTGRGVGKRVTAVLAGGLIPAGRQLLPEYGRVPRDSLKISGSALELAFARRGSRFGCFSERVL
jgi:hypothetical protein